MEQGTNLLTQTIDNSPPPFMNLCRTHNFYTAMAVSPSALKDLVKLPVAAELKQLGVKLGVRIHTLNEIQAFNHENSLNFARGCLRDILY